MTDLEHYALTRTTPPTFRDRADRIGFGLSIVVALVAAAYVAMVVFGVPGL